MKTIKNINVKNKRVLVRVDYDVPLRKGKVADNTRIRTSLPTIRYLRQKKAKVILISHLHRPKGVDPKLRFDSVAKELSKLLGKKVLKLDDCIGAKVEKKVSEMKSGDVVLLENLRFYPGEQKNKRKFAKQLAKLGDVYVNDSFAVSHRAHASIQGIPRYLPSVAGFQLQKEIETMGKILRNPKRPYVAVIGGAKVSSKIEVIESLLKKVDALLIGGAMMFTFLKATGKNVGKSKIEKDKVRIARKLLKKGHRKLMLPTDCVVASSPSGKASVVDVRRIPKGKMGLDIGPETTAVYKSILSQAKTVVWNGPVGMFEVRRFAKGTNEIAKSLAKSKAKVVIGGGDTVDAINKLKLGKKYTHVSTGGGASLDFIAGKKLPGIKALKR